MKRYEGWSEPGTGGAGTVVVTEDDGTRRPLAYRLDLYPHSPGGFAWGYAGSGPAQLALALVADATGDDQLARRVYQEFKFAIVAKFHATWHLSDEDVRDFVARIEQDRETA